MRKCHKCNWPGSDYCNMCYVEDCDKDSQVLKIARFLSYRSPRKTNCLKVLEKEDWIDVKIEEKFKCKKCNWKCIVAYSLKECHACNVERGHSKRSTMEECLSVLNKEFWLLNK